MDLIEFIYESNKSKTSDQLTNCFITFLNKLGFDRFIMGEMSSTPLSEKEENFGLLFNYPEDWLNHFIADHYADYDPVYQKICTTSHPFNWDDEMKENISNISLRVINQAKVYKIYRGVGFSIHQPFGRVIGFGVASSDNQMTPDKDTMSLLQAASQQFFESFSTLSNLNLQASCDEKITITKREREVLLWIASGKTKAEIASILSVSESCIKRHCENIFRKLDVNNLPFAVAKAIQLRLIQPR